MTNNFCYNCGEPVTGPDTNVCANCGKPLHMETDSTPYENYQQQNYNEYNEFPKAQADVVNQSPVIATVASFMLPGLGQLYNGKVGKGLILAACYCVGLCLMFIPGLIVWVYAMWDAYKEAEKMNRREMPFENPSFWGIMAFLLFWVVLYVIAMVILMMMPLMAF